jgi:hypothetical protein
MTGERRERRRVSRLERRSEGTGTVNLPWLFLVHSTISVCVCANDEIQNKRMAFVVHLADEFVAYSFCSASHRDDLKEEIER